MAGFDFAGKTVWVTGAGKGIGYTTALAFANAGAEVTGFDREFPQDNYPFATEVLDVANAGQVAEVCQRVLKARERLDVLVNAAGISRIGMSAYGASKAALKSLALTVGLELAGSGVRCNVVSPGSTDTDMQRTLWVSDDAEQQRIRGFGEQFKLGIPLGKIARPQEITNTILFLASDLASHITLQDIVVDGGSTLGA